MTESIKDFLARKDIKEMRDREEMGEVMSKDFFRDPFRAIHINHDLFYAPADGIVLYAKERVKPKDFLDIKGKDYSLAEMLADPDYDLPSLVVGIFMSAWDVHVNRVPASCNYLSKTGTSPIITHGISMLMMEKELLELHHFCPEDIGYLVHNEKQVSMFHSPAINSRFYIVQVADKDVDVILNWGKGRHLMQGDRFGQIRFGSQCDLILPIKKNLKYEILVKPMDHVEAGLDPIVRITKEKDDA
jgi:phosphatidylserine decarboxylase